MTTWIGENEYEERNRAAKAFRLVKACERVGWSADDVEVVPGTWDYLAKTAEVNPPSDRTKAIVLHILRERADG